MKNSLTAYLGALLFLLVADGLWLGLVVFAVLPALDRQNWKRSAALSALFGLLAYGTYDLSNLATLKDWPLQLALVDLVWGAALPCGAGTAGYFAARA